MSASHRLSHHKTVVGNYGFNFKFKTIVGDYGFDYF